MSPCEVTGRADWEVPAFRTYELGPRTSDNCICIPVINEGTTPHLATRANRGPAPRDGRHGMRWWKHRRQRRSGSVDQARRPHAAHQDRTGKISAQLRVLFAYALEQGYTGMVMIDGNGKDGVEAIPQFLDALSAGFDFVQGSRYLPGGSEENTPLDRKLASKLIHAPLLSMAAGFRYTDTTNGFRAFRDRFILDPRLQPFRNVFDTYNLHFYLSVMAPRLGYRVTELPVRRVYPASGPTPSKIGGIAGKLAILKLLLYTVMGRYRP